MQKDYGGNINMGGLSKEERRKALKEIIKQLHAGLSPQEIKEKFKWIIEGVSALEIAEIEQELIEEGIPREEIQRLCDIHLDIFREQLQKQQVKTTSEHPITILREEHKVLQQLLEKIDVLVSKIKNAENFNSIDEEIDQLKQIANELLDAEKHYVREENVLFPVLERHGITEPPAIMWTEHNQIREKKKKLYSLIENCDKMDFQDFKKQLEKIASSLSSTLSSHIFKENNILFQLALRVITEQEWLRIREDFDEIGYCCFTPTHLITKTEAVTVGKPQIHEAEILDDMIQFETGLLSKEELEAILNTLPIEITFVDKNDTVKYFNEGKKRIFIRTKAIIGRKVQRCHPQKSIHIVNRILEAFKNGEKDVAEFWINLDGRLVYIRYFAVRDGSGKYLGTMEVTQDITDIKKIEGEKRLLDWRE